MARALYRKYRSKSLDEIIGQSHITSVLQRSIEKDRVSHAYLLTGPRGVGKTSIARILAHEINRLPYEDDTTHLDIIEIDAASNNGVEDVRDLRDKVQLAPTSADKKVYIIDEVHMLSKPAFNALLKTLEEPPAHVVFILATTNPDKLPETIISRTQQFSFRAISPDDIVKQLKHIAKKEKISIDDEALELIALRSGGSFRDSISLLDQLSNIVDASDTITSHLVEESLGLAPHSLVESLLQAYEDKQLEKIVSLLADSDSRGVDATILAEQLIYGIRRTIATTPQLLPLLDALLEVEASSLPAVKLLTSLATHAAPQKPTSAALQASAPVFEAPIEELEKIATIPTPKDPPPTKRTASAPFDAGKLLDYTKKEFVAIYSVLVKCSFVLKADSLTIYAVNKFYKKKLDTPKYRQNLVSSLEAIGARDLAINTVATVCPPKDEQTAKVAAIMGGGEEVAVDSDGS